MKKEINLKNKKAYFNYEILETYTAGISLVGSEIKSIRENNLSFTDSYCIFVGNDLYVRNIHIDLYEKTSYNKPEPKRDRKLLLTRKELKQLSEKVKKQGTTIIPLKVFLINGWAKLEIGLAKGKKNFDKRNSIKEKDLKREQERYSKNDY